MNFYAFRALVPEPSVAQLRPQACTCRCVEIRSYVEAVQTSEDVIQCKCVDAKSACLSSIETRAVCLFASRGGLGGRMDEVCFQTGVTHYVCVCSCWAEGWMVIMAFSTTTSSRSAVHKTHCKPGWCVAWAFTSSFGWLYWCIMISFFFCLFVCFLGQDRSRYIHFVSIDFSPSLYRVEGEGKSGCTWVKLKMSIIKWVCCFNLATADTLYCSHRI